METVSQINDPPGDVERAIEWMHDRGAEIAKREYERALDRLQSKGELSESDRRILRQLADGLVEDLLAVPEHRLREAGEKGAGDVPAVTPSMFSDE